MIGEYGKFWYRKRRKEIVYYKKEYVLKSKIKIL